MNVRKKIYQCQKCGKILPRHDEGYRHWVICVEGVAPEDPKR